MLKTVHCTLKWARKRTLIQCNLLLFVSFLRSLKQLNNATTDMSVGSCMLKRVSRHSLHALESFRPEQFTWE